MGMSKARAIFLIPKWMRNVMSYCGVSLWSLVYRKKALAFCESQKGEYDEIADYLRKYKRLNYFQYEFAEEYKKKDIKVFKDENGFCYVLRNGKKLYGKDYWKKGDMQGYFCGLFLEQDARSPHAYFPGDSASERKACLQGGSLADIGAAEGIFALDVIDDVKEVYLFECDEEWIAPLRRTFGPWKDKVHFVKKYVGKEDNGNVISLDTFFRDKELTHVKADIEGAEEDMLDGSREVFKNKVKASWLCAYHKPNALEQIKERLDRVGFDYEINRGYIFFPNGIKLVEPYYRRGALYSKRKR